MNAPIQKVPPRRGMDAASSTRLTPSDRAAIHRVPLPKHLPSVLSAGGIFAIAPSDESHLFEPTTLAQPQHIEAVRILAYIADAWNLKDAETAGLLGVGTAEWTSLYRTMLLVPPRLANRDPNRCRGTANRYRGHRTVDPAFGEYDASYIFRDVLSEEHLARISDVSAIYRALQCRNMEYFEPDWLFEQHTAKVFDGKSPLNAMIEGGTAKIQEVRKFLGGRFMD